MNTKQITSFLALLMVCSWGFAKDVHLKITYHGQAVVGHHVVVKNGNMVVGEGKTDEDGLIQFPDSRLLDRSVDVYGTRVCEDVEKTWEVKGWVQLSEENAFHLKMEEVIDEMAGKGISGSSVGHAWGLTADACSGQVSESGVVEEEVVDREPEEDDETHVERFREEKLKVRRYGLENEISMFDNRIFKNKLKIEDFEEDGEISENELRRARIDLEQNELRREKRQLELDEVNAELAGEAYDREERKASSARQKAIDEEITALELEDDRIRMEEKEMKKAQKFDSMSKGDLKKHIVDMKANRKSKKLSIKLKGSRMEPARKKQLEKEIKILDATIIKYEKRLEQLRREDGKQW